MEPSLDLWVCIGSKIEEVAAEWCCFIKGGISFKIKKKVGGVIRERDRSYRTARDMGAARTAAV